MENEEEHDPISDALGINPVTNTGNIVKTIIAEAHDDSAMKDFETARANLMEIIENASTSISNLAGIAESSQHPRHFEVLAKLMDTAVNANKQLLELQSKIRELNKSDEPHNERAKNITNNLFVGSTAELQKMIQDMKKE